MAKVLIVDDAKFMQVILTPIFEDAGHTVVGYGSDGIEGFELYKKLKPDLVTLDITMPKRNGLSCLKDIRSYDNNATVIMCSAMGQQSLLIEAIQYGASEFIIKPFKKDRILDTLKKLGF